MAYTSERSSTPIMTFINRIRDIIVFYSFSLATTIYISLVEDRLYKQIHRLVPSIADVLNGTKKGLVSLACELF